MKNVIWGVRARLHSCQMHRFGHVFPAKSWIFDIKDVAMAQQGQLGAEAVAVGFEIWGRGPTAGFLHSLAELISILQNRSNSQFDEVVSRRQQASAGKGWWL